MRIEDDGIELKLVLSDSGEIARVLLAFSKYNKSLASTTNGQCRIPVHIMDVLEECLEA